jgi:Tfp pilus assembly protein PilN
MPDMLWLTDLKQDGGAVTIQGRSNTLIALSDFVGNLGTNALVQKPIEIVNSQLTEEQGAKKGQQAAQLVSFTVKVQLAGVQASEPAKKKGRA